jgi:ribulose-phosphate 3-epimerase
MLKISPSILSADFSRLGEEVKKVEDAGADMLHIDVMDGHFVPNLSIGPMVVRSIRGGSRLPFDVHLMVEGPAQFVDAFSEAGADYITLHADNVHRLYPTMQSIKKLGKRVGVALCPLTPLNVLEYVLGEVDLVLLMCVEPGFGGQPFMESVLPKIGEAKRMIDSKGLKVDLAVDGGINERTAPQVVAAGANVLVMGSAVFSKKSTRELEEMFQSIRRLSPD